MTAQWPSFFFNVAHGVARVFSLREPVGRY
jgi:hypothetical protein